MAVRRWVQTVDYVAPWESPTILTPALLPLIRDTFHWHVLMVVVNGELYLLCVSETQHLQNTNCITRICFSRTGQGNNSMVLSRWYLWAICANVSGQKNSSTFGAKYGVTLAWGGCSWGFEGGPGCHFLPARTHAHTHAQSGISGGACGFSRIKCTKITREILVLWHWHTRTHACTQIWSQTTATSWSDRRARTHTGRVCLRAKVGFVRCPCNKLWNKTQI